MRVVGRIVSGVEPTLPTIDSVKLKNSIHALPKVHVAYRHHLPKTLPSPIVFLPFGQPKQDALLDITGAADQRHPRRLVEGFQGADDRQQVEPLTAYVGFNVGGFDFWRSVEGSQHEPPCSESFGPARFRLQQVMGCLGIHRGFLRRHYGESWRSCANSKAVTTPIISSKCGGGWMGLKPTSTT